MSEKTTAPELRLYDLKELQEILHVSYRTLLKYVNSGALKGRKIGKEWRITQANLDAFINGDS